MWSPKKPSFNLVILHTTFLGKGGNVTLSKHILLGFGKGSGAAALDLPGVYIDTVYMYYLLAISKHLTEHFATQQNGLA